MAPSAVHEVNEGKLWFFIFVADGSESMNDSSDLSVNFTSGLLNKRQTQGHYSKIN